MDTKLGSQAVADKLGIKARTWRAYVARHQAPQPDGTFAGRSWWYESTINQWSAARPRTPT